MKFAAKADIKDERLRSSGDTYFSAASFLVVEPKQNGTFTHRSRHFFGSRFVSFGMSVPFLSKHRNYNVCLG